MNVISDFLKISRISWISWTVASLLLIYIQLHGLDTVNGIFIFEKMSDQSYGQQMHMCKTGHL